MGPAVALRAKRGSRGAQRGARGRALRVVAVSEGGVGCHGELWAGYTAHIAVYPAQNSVSDEMNPHGSFRQRAIRTPSLDARTTPRRPPTPEPSAYTTRPTRGTTCSGTTPKKPPSGRRGAGRGPRSATGPRGRERRARCRSPGARGPA